MTVARWQRWFRGATTVISSRVGGESTTTMAVMEMVTKPYDDLELPLPGVNEIDDDGRSIATTRLVIYREMTGVKYWSGGETLWISRLRC
ncbi:unnamed protein product [Linum trigynum]|uniref:Uncharacterized protein n=1 Tax=Linum trigynum TaxID=586398 RepID=A0AAV2G7S5_9ROSI